MVAQGWAGKVAVIVGCGVIVGGVAASAATPAKIPDSKTGLITSCMTKKTGAVRFINAQKGDKCTKKEKKVTFNQTGPTGAQGERGPSNGYTASRTDTANLNQLHVGPNTLVSLTLPAGSYTIAANTSVTSATGDTTFTCALTAAAGTLTQTPASAKMGNGDIAALGLTATYTTGQTTTVGYLCQPSAAFPTVGGGAAQGATIVATQLAQLAGP